MAWFNAWTWQLTLGLMLVIIPLIFPTGRPPSPSWRPLLWLGIGFAAAWTLSAAFRRGTIYLDWPSDDSVTNPVGLTFLSGWWLVLSDERAGPPPVALAAVIAAGALINGLVQARGEERQQLKWRVFAGAGRAGWCDPHCCNWCVDRWLCTRRLGHDRASTRGGRCDPQKRRVRHRRDHQ